MTGLLIVSMSRSVSWPRRDTSMPLSGVIWESSAMSAPAMKAFCPAPVTITPRTLLSPSSSSHAERTSRTVAAFNAFSLSGLLMVTMAIASRRSTLMY